MRIKDGYELKDVGGEKIIFPTTKSKVSFNGMISLNETGAFIFSLVNEGKSYDDILKAMLDEYEIDEAKAKEDLDAFIAKLVEQGVIEDER